jgi:hypothetical protein
MTGRKAPKSSKSAQDFCHFADAHVRRKGYAIGTCPVIGYKTVSVRSCGNTDHSYASSALTGPLPRSLRDIIDTSCTTAALLLPWEHLNLASLSDSTRNIRLLTATGCSHLALVIEISGFSGSDQCDRGVQCDIT